MKKLLLIIAIMFIAMFTTQVYADSGSISNESLNVKVSNSGRFVAETADGKTLMFDTIIHGDYTSWTTIRIDDQDYTFGGTNAFNNNVCVTDFYIAEKNINVRQILTIVYNTFTRLNDTVEIKYIISNQGELSRSIGTRVMIDTMIETNDGAPFRVPGYGSVTNEMILAGDSVPSYWQVFNDLSNPQLFAQGTLATSSDSYKPDKILFTNWQRIRYYFPWDYSPSGGPIGEDSAVALYWNQEELKPGETREYVTYYGLGKFESNLVEPVALSITAQNEADADESFVVTAYFQNILDVEVANVTAKLQLPDQFSTLTTIDVNLGHFYSGEIKQHSWEVKIALAAATQEYTYSVQVTSDIGESNVLSKTINVKAIVHDILAEWYRSINSVHEEGLDENKLIIKASSDASYWTPWTGDFNLDNASTGKEQYLFRTTIDVPANATGLDLIRDGDGSIVVDDVFSVFVNGFKVSEENYSGLESISIDKKYLMLGAKNDILLYLKDLQPNDTRLSKMKIQASLDPSYNEEKVIDFNGFKIQYDESNPLNSKIVKCPENLIVESYQFEEEPYVVYGEDGRVEYAAFSVKISGGVYKYNGWHRLEKLFSSNSNSKIYFETNYEVADVQFEEVRFEQLDLDFFNIQDSIANLNAELYNDGTVFLVPKAEFDIFGEKKECCLYVTIKDNNLSIKSDGRFDLNEYLEVSSKNDEYSQISDLDISGGFTIDLFTKEKSGFNLEVSAYDDSKIRLKIPEFADMSFTSVSIDENTITAKGLDFAFAEDCVFEGLRSDGNPKPYSLEFNELGFNRRATGLSDLISSCDLTVTINENKEIFEGTGLYLKSGAKFKGTVKDDVFGIGFDGVFILPDESPEPENVEVGVQFSIDTGGNFDFGASTTLPNGFRMGNLDLSPDVGVSTIGFQYINSVYENYVQVSPKKFCFYFTNVGTQLDIKGAGKVKFYINEFTFDEDGKVENIKATIGTELSLLNDNLIITTGSEGKISLEYDSGEWIFDAKDVLVSIPKVPDDGFEAVTNLRLSTSNGLESFGLKDPDNELKIFRDVITINGLGLTVTKDTITDKYSLKIAADNAVCDIKKAIPSVDGDAAICLSNLSLEANDLSNPTIEILCDKVKYDRHMELMLGLKFEAEGIELDIDNDKIVLLDAKVNLPQIGGLKFYNADGSEVTNSRIGVDYLGASYADKKWELIAGNIILPDTCVYNLAEANVCKISLTGLSMGKNDEDKFEFRVEKASATVKSGYTTELSDVTISDTVSIGGGSITIPELTIGGMGINNFKVTFGTEKIKGKKYPYFGGECNVIMPGLASVDGSLIVQRYSENFFGTIKGASFELTLGKAIPLGSSGLSLKMIRGSLTRGELPDNFPDHFRFMFETGGNLKMVSMGLGLVDTPSGGKTLSAGADVWIEVTDWGFALELNASVFEGFVQAQAGAAYANEIFAAHAKVRVLCIEGEVILYVYKYDGETSVSGEGAVRVRLESGRILNKKIWRWRIKIPKNDVWFEGISAKFGRFTNGKKGFQGRVNFPILGGMSAFVGDGGLKFFTNYDIYIPKPTTTTASSAPLLASLAPMNYLFADAFNVAAVSSAPVFDDIYEGGAYKGQSVEFSLPDNSLERVVLSASTYNGIPNIIITGPDSVVSLNDVSIEYEIKEVDEVDEVSGNETGVTGITTLLAIKNPGPGNWRIEARNNEEVTLSLITKINEPSLKINSVAEDKSAKRLTVTGEIENTNNTENVNIILRGAPKIPPTDTNAQNTIMPSERIVATSDTNQVTDGVVLFAITGGKFTFEIDTSIMKSGTYSLVAEMQRKVMCKVGDEIFSEADTVSVTPDTTAEEEYDVYSREEYKVGNAVAVYEFENNDMQKVTNLNAKVTSYGTELFETGDVNNTFINKLINRDTDVMLNYIWNKLPGSARDDLTSDTDNKFSIVADVINTHIIKDSSFYNPTIFNPSDSQITDAIRRLIAKKNAGTVTTEEEWRLNRLLLEAYYPNDFAPNRKFNLDVSFNNVTKTAEGFLMFARYYIDGAEQGVRKTNLGSLTEVRIGGYTQYASIAGDGSISQKPVRMMVSIVPYKYIDPTKGFIYDFDTDLGFGEDVEENNIVLGPESNEVEVWIRDSYDYIIDSYSGAIPVGGYEVPVEETQEVDIGIVANAAGTVIAEVESVTSRKVTVSEEEISVENVTVVFLEDTVDVTSGTTDFKFYLNSNVDVQEALANTTGEARIRLSNINNPDNFVIVTVPYRFKISNLTIDSVYPETVNSMTGGIVDIYGAKLLKGTKVYLGTEELQIIDTESGISRIAAIVPEDFTPGQYDLRVVGVGTSNTAVWKNKINIVEPAYEWVKIRDEGKVQQGTTGKFYFSLDSDTGYLGEAGLRVKNVPAGWIVQLSDTKVEMNEVVTVSVSVPAGETVGNKNIIIEGNDSSSSSYYDIGKILVTVTDTPLEPYISALSTNKGYVGDSITIYGEGFTSQTVAEFVYGSDMSMITIDTNLLEAEIPSGAVSGDIHVDNNGTYSNSLPFTVIPDGIITNFDTRPVHMVLVPGESRTININNNRYSIDTASGASIITVVDSSTGNIKITVPADTRPGVYEVFVNTSYPNAIAQSKVVVYVVRGGKTTEELSRQVIFEGRNLSVKVLDGSITSMQMAKLELNGVPLSIVPQKVADGWLINVGMLQDGSVLAYQFDYTAYGNNYKTPVYGYMVEYENIYSDSDIYEVSLYENDSEDVLLRVTPSTSFNPTNMVVTYKLNNGSDITANMQKVGPNFEVSLGNLEEDTYVSGSFVYGTGIEDVTSQKFLLHYDAKYTSNVEIPVDISREINGKVILRITSPGFKVEGRDINPVTVTAIVQLSTGETIKTSMGKTPAGYSADLGSISSGIDITYSFEVVVDGIRYITAPATHKYTDTGYEDYQNGLIGEYFDNQDFTNKKLTTLDPVIDFDWSTTTPAGGLVENSTYSMRWTGKIQPHYSEEYTFFATVPNGKVKVWVNDIVIMEGYGSKSGKVTLTSAQMADIIVEYSSLANGGIKLEWQSSSLPREIVPEHRIFKEVVNVPGGNDEEPNGKLRVQYTNEDNQRITNHLKPDFKIFNESSENILFSDIKVRYWFTNDAKGMQSTTLYWASREQENVLLKLVKLDSDTGEYYLEIGFKGTAELAPGESVEVKASVNLLDWSMKYDQSDDYSFRSIACYQYEDYNKITAYTGDELAWGTKPDNSLPYTDNLDVLSYNENKSTNPNIMSPSIAVLNRDSVDVSLKKIEIRYWFTNETEKEMIINNAFCSLGDNILTVNVVLNGNTQRSYVEFTFKDDAPVVKVDEYFVVKADINAKDWSDISKTNDYSFNATETAFRENMKVTAYVNDKLVWGIEP